MKIDVKIERLEKRDAEGLKDMYHLKMRTYKETIEGRFEKSDLRQLIETIDNALI